MCLFLITMEALFGIILFIIIFLPYDNLYQRLLKENFKKRNIYETSKNERKSFGLKLMQIQKDQEDIINKEIGEERKTGVKNITKAVLLIYN